MVYIGQPLTESTIKQKNLLKLSTWAAHVIINGWTPIKINWQIRYSLFCSNFVSILPIHKQFHVFLVILSSCLKSSGSWMISWSQCTKRTIKCLRWSWRSSLQFWTTVSDWMRSYWRPLRLYHTSEILSDDSKFRLNSKLKLRGLLPDVHNKFKLYFYL